MNIQKVIDRKNAKTKKVVSRIEKRKQVVAMFRDYVLSQTNQNKLIKAFPYIVIDDSASDNVIGVSYSPSQIAGFKRCTISSSTYNIVLSSTKEQFNIGYGANTASFSKVIPFDIDMNKTQLKRVFKQVLECLVSEAYHEHSLKRFKESNKPAQVWKGFEQIV